MQPSQKKAFNFSVNPSQKPIQNNLNTKVLNNPKPKPKPKVNKQTNKKKVIEKKEEERKKNLQTYSAYCSMLRQKYNMNPYNIKRLQGGHESDSYIVKVNGINYILKFQRASMAQLSLGHYKIQNEVLLHLQKENEKNEEKQRILYPQIISTTKKEAVFKGPIEGRNYYIKMLNFLQGRNIKHQEYHTLRNSLMRAVGIMHRDLSNFKFQNKQKIDSDALKNLYPLVQRNKLIKLVINSLKLKVPVSQCEQTIKTFKQQNIFLFDYFRLYRQKFIGLLQSVRKCICHCDLHSGNILTDQKGTRVISIIDFGWTLRYGYFWKDLQYVLRSWLSSNKSFKPKKIGDLYEMISTYHQYYPLTQQQIQCMYFVIGNIILRSGKKKKIPGNSFLQTGQLNQIQLAFLKTNLQQFVLKIKKEGQSIKKTQLTEEEFKKLQKEKTPIFPLTLPFDKQQLGDIPLAKVLSGESCYLNFIPPEVWEELFEEIEETDPFEKQNIKNYLSKRWIQQDMGDKAPRGDLFISWAQQVFYEDLQLREQNSGQNSEEEEDSEQIEDSYEDALKQDKSILSLEELNEKMRKQLP